MKTVEFVPPSVDRKTVEFVPPSVDIFGNPIRDDVRALMIVNSRRLANPQRSQGWKDERNQMVTASSAASIFKLSQIEIDLRDQGIIDLEFDKKVGQVMPAFNSFAKELRIKSGAESSGDGNVYTEWGVAYEPVVKDLWQCIHGMEIHDFGLIRHNKHEWLGASPDGVTSSGRMVEIKCPYSRMPKGLPKCQYWVQMQIQMECCGFRECEFLEIVTREYTCREDYLADVYGSHADGSFVYARNSKGMAKGIIIEHAQTITEDDGQTRVRYEYFYPPALTFKSVNEENEWIRNWSKNHFGANPMTPDRMTDWMLTHGESYRLRYWYVEDWKSCVVAKNDEWLAQRLPEIRDFWSLVLKCRKEGLPDKYRLRSSTSTSSDTPSLQSWLETTPETRPSAIEQTVGLTTTECLFVDDGDDDDGGVTNKPVNGNKAQATKLKRSAAGTASAKLRKLQPQSAPACLFDDTDGEADN